MTDNQEEAQPVERKVWTAPVLTEVDVVVTTLGSYNTIDDGGGGHS